MEDDTWYRIFYMHKQPSHFFQFSYLVYWLNLLILFPLTLFAITPQQPLTFDLAWGSQGKQNGQFQQLYGIAVDKAGDIYVADTDNNRIQRFDSNGNFIDKWGTAGSQDSKFNQPTDIAVDNTHFIYVTDTQNNRIQKFDINNKQVKFITSWGTLGSEKGQFNQPIGIATDTENNVYVADTKNYRIQKFDNQGHFLTQWGEPGNNEGQFQEPVGIVVDSLNQIYVTDAGDNHRVQQFDSEGHFLKTWGQLGFGFGQFHNPQGIAVDQWDYVYVVDSNNHRIQKFDSTGTFLTHWGTNGTGGGQFSFPLGIAINSAGLVYVADSGNHRVQKFMEPPPSFLFQWSTKSLGDSKPSNPHSIVIDNTHQVYVTDHGADRIQKFDLMGNFIAKWGKAGSGNGEFNYPDGIAIDNDSYLYIADKDNNRIQKLASDGTFITAWGSEGSQESQLESPLDVAVDNMGYVYVVVRYHRVQKFDNQGNFIKSWGTWGGNEGEFKFPQAIAVDQDHYVYVADIGNHRIQKFDQEGQFILQWGNPDNPNSSQDGEFNSSFYGIGIDKQGYVYIADTDNYRIQKFTPNGQFLTKWGGIFGKEAGQFNNPYDVAIDDSTGNIYITDSENDRIQVFGIPPNQAPIHHLPSYELNTTEDQTLVFSVSNDNLISISDEDAGNEAIQVTLTASYGTLTLSNTSGLNFSNGDGVADPSMTFIGNLSNINLILNGMQFIPLPDYHGNTSIQIITDDQGSTGSGGAQVTTDTIPITVNPLADTPQITNATTDEGIQTTSGLVISRSPADGEEVGYFKITHISNGTLFHHDGTTLIKAGEFITFNQGNAGLKFTPNSIQNGQFEIQAALTPDDSGLGGEPVTALINVGAVNDPPMLQPIGNKTVSLGNRLTFTVHATDPDIPADNLRFSLKGAPLGATLDSANGQFTWNPSQAGTFTFTIVVTDDGSNPDQLSDSEEITVTVGNTSPLLKPIGDQTVALGDLLTFTANAIDAENQILVFSLEDEPKGAAINPITGQFNWQPTQAGRFTTTIVVTDADGLSTRETITIHVGNTPPILAAITDQLVQPGDILTFQATATDAENNALKFSLNKAPLGAVIDPTTGVFTWTPTQNGVVNFTVVVTDNAGLSDQQTVTITVAQEPVLTEIGNQTAVVNQLLTFTAHAVHPSEIPLIFSLHNAPLGAAIDPTTGQFTWTPLQQGVVDITVVVTDVNGKSDSETITITVTIAATQLKLTLSSNTLLLGDTVQVEGWLQRFPNTEMGNLAHYPLQLIITLPDKQHITEETQTQANGKYLIKNLPPLNQEGRYLFQTQFLGTINLQPTQSPLQTVTVHALAGYAVLVQGKSIDNSGLEAHNKSLNRIYQILKLRGFTDDKIEYFNHTLEQFTPNIEIDGIPTQLDIQIALKRLQAQLNAQPAPFYMIMIDHGGVEGVFSLDESQGEYLKPTDLDNWLTELEAGLNPKAIAQPRIIMIGSCYSGRFIPKLSKPGRLIITSTAANEESYKGLKEPDEIRSGEYFMEALFAQLGRGKSLQTAFKLATHSTEIFTLIDNNAPFDYFYQDRAAQHPLLEDNADQKGSNVLLLGQDGGLANPIYLGLGPRYDSNAPNNPAEIITVTPTIHLSSQETHAQLFATVNNSNRVQGNQVIVDIRSPSVTLQRTGIETREQLELNELNRIYLTPSEANRFVSEFNAFSEPGQYKLFYFVTDTQTGQISPLQRSLVYKRQAGNYPPRSFRLNIPLADSQTSTTVIFDWEDATDPEYDNVTYTFELATDPDFNHLVYHQAQLPRSVTYLDNTILIEDELNEGKPGLRDGTRYYWQVAAIDSFGGKTVSEVFSFQTNNTNAPPSVASIQLLNSINFFSLETADLSFWQIDESGNLITDEQGNPIPIAPPPIYQEPDFYHLLLPQGRRRLQITAPGFETQAMDIDTTTTQPQLTVLNSPESVIDHPNALSELKVKMIPTQIDDHKPGQLQFAVTELNIQENQTRVEILVERVQGQDGEVAVSFNTIDGTAIAGSDYQHSSGTLNWSDQDDHLQRISLVIYNDTEFERDETLTIALANPTGGSVLGSEQLTLTIQDDDNPQIRNANPSILQFTTADDTFSEAAGLPSSVMVTRSGSSQGLISVQYVAIDEGTATKGTDYIIEKNTLTWGEADIQNKPLPITIIDDNQNEPLETIHLMLFNPTGDAILGTPAQMVLTIQDDDNPELTESDLPESSSSTSTALEPSSATPTELEPNSSTSTALEANEPVQIDSEPTSQPDNNSTDSEPTTSEPNASQSVESLEESSIESSGAGGLLQFTQFFYEFNEGQGKLTTIQVERVDGNTGEVSVQYQVLSASEAIPDQDFVGGSGTLTWGDKDDSAQLVSLHLLDDDETENDENIFLSLHSPQGAQLGQPNTITITVNDNDSDEILQFSKSFYIVNEGDGNLENIMVERTGNSSSTASVEYTIRSEISTALFDRDYIAVNGQLDWAKGEQDSKEIPIYLIDDNEVEDKETIILILHNQTNAQIGSRKQARIVITDNDERIPFEALQPGTLQFTSPIYSAVETENRFTEICVERVLGYQGAVSVQYQVTERSTATQDLDYTLAFNTLRWSGNEITPKCLTLTLNSDNLEEGFELIHLKLTQVTGQAELGLWAETQLLLADNEAIVGSKTANEQLPYLGQATIIPLENNLENQSVFWGGISLDDLIYRNLLTLSVLQPVKIRGKINIDPLYIGQLADILVVACSSTSEQCFMRNSHDQINSWDLDVTHLVAAREQVSLSAIESIDIYTGRLIPGQFRIFFGYRLDNGMIVYNGQPIEVNVQF